MGFFDSFLDVFMVYPTNCLIGAVEWGFLFRRYQVWNNFEQETVELDPFKVSNSYVYRYMYSIVSCFVVYCFSMALMQYLFTFRGRQNAKKGVSKLEEDEQGVNRDVKKEKNDAIRASKAIESGRLTLMLQDEEEQA